jgi:hypothetical protein
MLRPEDIVLRLEDNWRFWSYPHPDDNPDYGIFFSKWSRLQNTLINYDMIDRPRIEIKWNNVKFWNGKVMNTPYHNSLSSAIKKKYFLLCKILMK